MVALNVRWASWLAVIIQPSAQHQMCQMEPFNTTEQAKPESAGRMGEVRRIFTKNSHQKLRKGDLAFAYL